MDTTTITPQQAVMYAALLNAGIGFVLGLIPLIAGFVKGNVKMGLAGLAASTLGGAILGILLSIPAAAFFTYLIVRGQKRPPEVVVVNRDPIDIAVKEDQ